MNKSTEMLYQEREKRIMDVVELKKPDMVPIGPGFGFFAARYEGMTIKETMYDPEKIRKAHWKVLMDFQPDMCENPFGSELLGPALEELDFKQMVWPGHGLDSDNMYQFVEGEYMKAEEYDHFLSDPTDFVLRRYWPRVCGALKGLGMIPPLRDLTSQVAFANGLAPLAFPDVVASLQALAKAASHSLTVMQYSMAWAQDTREAGFPMAFGGGCLAPFDSIGDFFRGTKGIMLDMYRRPDTVIKACEKVLPYTLEATVAMTRMTGVPRVMIPIHKGIDGFMSMEQFKKFYWPTLKELMEGLIAEGLIPCPLWEGNCTSRLEVIKDIPAGKAMYAFESTRYLQGQRGSRRQSMHTGESTLDPAHGRNTGRGKSTL